MDDRRLVPLTDDELTEIEARYRAVSDDLAEMAPALAELIDQARRDIQRLVAEVRRLRTQPVE